MKSIINKALLTFSVLVSLVGLNFYAVPAVLAAPSSTVVALTPKDQICQGVGAVTGNADCTSTSGQPTVDKVLKLALSILSFVVGVIAVIMLIVGGLKYILSQGESAQTASAKNTILYAIVGMVVAALAQVIVRFVLSKTV